VAVAGPLDRALTYSIPAALADSVREGSIVEVPLRSRLVRGVVTALRPRPAYGGPIRSLERHLSPDYALSAELIELAHWLADYYWCAPGEALAAVAFFGLQEAHALYRTALELADPGYWLGVSREVGPDGAKVTANQGRALHALLSGANEPMTPVELQHEAGVGPGVLETMLRRGWLRRVEEPVARPDDYPAVDGPPLPPPEPTSEQRVALAAIREALSPPRYRTFLIHGVTGSGKTELYLRVIEEALRMGRSAIVLAPEIALTPQMVSSFRGRLGPVVGVYHSRMSIGQKYDLWRRIDRGETRVLIGARSAVFAPLPALGVLVVDEEHETTYKQAEAPRYHARDVAVWRAARAGAVALLGSATPSLESLHNAREGKYERLTLPRRIGPNAPPVMTLIDMKRHLSQGGAEEGAGLLSPALKSAIAERLDRGEQTILLLNRRGFANQVLCLRCERTLECPHCDVSLTYHKAIGRMICHWCGHDQALPERCPQCGQAELRPLGLGTQRVEELLAQTFASARLLRMDLDSMKGRRSFLEAWRAISNREVDVILGTQMIAKGFHLESVTLVGVISADFALFLPDFRSAERTFNLLTQVAGRAGRGARPGEVIVQTYIPRHYAIELAAANDAEAFYEREMRTRRLLRFPPVGRLIAVLLSGADAAAVRDQAFRLGNILKALARRPRMEGAGVLGPAPAPIGKIENRYRWRLLLRGPRPGQLHELLAEGLKAFDRVHDKARIRLTVDVDPMDLL